MTAIPKSRLWLLRLPGLAAATVSAVGLGMVVTSVLFNPAVTDGGLLAASLAFALGVAAGLVLSLRLNRLGIYAQGLAPPVKPLRGILSEPWILPWKDLTAIVVIPRPRSRTDLRKGAAVRIVSVPRRMEWLLAGDLLAKSFGGSVQAERFIAVLGRIGEQLRERGRPLSYEEVSVLSEK